jgi:hypothetical protein
MALALSAILVALLVGLFAAFLIGLVCVEDSDADVHRCRPFRSELQWALIALTPPVATLAAVVLRASRGAVWAITGLVILAEVLLTAFIYADP